MDQREQLLDAVIGAIPAWQVLVVQFNARVALRLGISPADMQCLFVLSQQGASSPGAIAGYMNITTGSASRMVERLLTAGLVKRESNTSDRRRVVVSATPAALAQVAEHYDKLNGKLREHLSAMSDATLHDLLTFVTRAETTTADLVRSLHE